MVAAPATGSRPVGGAGSNRRRDLYKEFIEDASKCYVDALQHDTGDIPSWLHSMQRSVECAFCRRRLFWQALRKYEEKFSILMLNPTRVFPSSASLSEPTDRSIFSASLARLAAGNSMPCARLCDRTADRRTRHGPTQRPPGSYLGRAIGQLFRAYCNIDASDTVSFDGG